MLAREEIEDGLKEMEFETRIERGSAGQTFTWRSKEILCTPTTVDRGSVVDFHGNLLTVGLTLIVRRSHFVTADSTLITVDSDLYMADSDTPTPVAGRTLIFRGQTLRILSARESSLKSHFLLSLADPASNQ